MRYTRKEREELARRKEQWILRTGRGEAPEQISRELKLNLKSDALRRLKQRYQAGGRKWQALLGQGVRDQQSPRSPALYNASMEESLGNQPIRWMRGMCFQQFFRRQFYLPLCLVFYSLILTDRDSAGGIRHPLEQIHFQ